MDVTVAENKNTINEQICSRSSWSNARYKGLGMYHQHISKYRSFPSIDLPTRQWPSRTIATAPIWCSVDLRDGNQALAIPMSVEKKMEMFRLLVEIGFKEIEVGFPSASQIEFNFMRQLVRENAIPDDVTIQVLVQARAELIYRTFEALKGVPRAIVHLYNSTSPAQRRIVFGMSKIEVIELAVHSTQLIKSLVPSLPETLVSFQYSPESFSATEVDFALEICESVIDVWQPTSEHKLILNLPATVEVATPNVYADQIEWFCHHLHNRNTVIISLHTHNDRGTGIAATELGLLAGAERVEGTLFGNGERTGNADIVTLALNMYTQGVNPGLNFRNINHVREVYERCTCMTVHERHPYAGDLVFTAFSGSHQDAIKKGMMAQDSSPGTLWDVPYLPIDPQDIGRTYEAVIRINSQSGKGGVAYVLETEYELQMPKAMQIEFGKIINDIADVSNRELFAADIRRAFDETYLRCTSPFKLETFQTKPYHHGDGTKNIECVASISIDGVVHEIHGIGIGPINAFVLAMKEELVSDFELVYYAEHSLSTGDTAEAIAYIQIQTLSGSTFFGAGIDTNINFASIKAILSALNRAYQSRCTTIATQVIKKLGAT